MKVLSLLLLLTATAFAGSDGPTGNEIPNNAPPPPPPQEDEVSQEHNRDLLILANALSNPQNLANVKKYGKLAIVRHVQIDKAEDVDSVTISGTIIQGGVPCGQATLSISGSYQLTPNGLGFSYTSNLQQTGNCRRAKQ